MFFEGPGSRYVEIEPAQSQGVEVPIAVLSVLKADIACVSKAMLCWSTTKEVSFTRTGCEHVMSVTMMKVLKKLVQDNAFLPSTEHASGHSAATSFDAEELACLWTLTQLGFVCSLSDSEANANFVFTKLGAQSLRHVQQCTAPVRFFKSPAELGDIPRDALCYCSQWELLKLLQAEGWELRKAPAPKVRKRQPLPSHKLENYENRCLLWYVAGTTLRNSKPYVLCLLNAKTFLESAQLVELHHCQPIKY